MTANAIGSAIVKTVKAVQFNIGGGLGIGFETQLKIKNIPIQVSALASEKMILEVTKNGADIKNVISAQGGIGNLGYEYGREHSYVACKEKHNPVMTSFGKLFECPYSEKINEGSAVYGVGASFYAILGGEIFIGIDIEEVIRAWIEAYDNAFTVNCY